MRNLAWLLLMAPLSACLTAKVIVDKFNSPMPRTAPRFPDCATVIADVLQDTLADAYTTPTISDVLRSALAHQQLGHVTACVREKNAANESDQDCMKCLFGDGTPACSAITWPAPPTLAETDVATWRRERDVQRLQENAQRAVRTIAQTCVALEGAGGTLPTEDDLAGAWRDGLKRFFDYSDKRPALRRDGKPVTAWVLAGGAANGAFSAGAAWWLLTQHKACATCGDDRVDLLGGASTGTMIASLTKAYFAEGATDGDRALALQTLLSRYTCSVNSQLYCVQDVGMAELLDGKSSKHLGLVDFDGVRKLLQAETANLDRVHKRPEQFASSVEFASGAVYHFSSVLTEDSTAWAQALEASIVEPFIAQPVRQVGSLTGLFIDGGVRSGLPLVTALNRGADRAIVFANTTLAGVPVDSFDNTIGVGIRALDLFALQPIFGELATAERERVLRRQGEKERCLARLGFDAAGAAAVDLEVRCSAEYAAPGMKPMKHAGTMRNAMSKPEHVSQPGTPQLDRLPDAYQSAWLFMPTTLPDTWKQLGIKPPNAELGWGDLAAPGYKFDPRQMWNLFVLGAVTAQQRCEEIVKTLGWSLDVAKCTSDAELRAALAKARQQFDDKQCLKRSLETRPCCQPVPP